MPDPVTPPAGDPNAGNQPNAGASGQNPAGAPAGQQPANPNPGAPAGEGSPPAGGAAPAAPAAGQTPAADPNAPAGGQQPAAGDPPVTPPAPPATWPQDWRQQQIKEAGIDDKDGKVLKQLERFASPGGIVKAMLEQQALISSGKIKQPLAADATPEQKATWRKENGIPEKATDYNLDLPDGLVIGENDKAILTPIVERMHDLNMTPDQVKGAVAVYKAQEKQFLQAREKMIGDNHQVTEDVLRKEWGEEYRNENTRIDNLVATWSANSQNAFKNGFDDKGMPLKDNVNFMRDMAQLARTINPVSTLIPNGGGSQGASVDTEIANIEKRMETDRDGYFKDQAMQNRYGELLAWRENQKKK